MQTLYVIIKYLNVAEILHHIVPVGFVVQGTVLFDIRGAVKKFPEMWYSTVIVGHMTTLT